MKYLVIILIIIFSANIFSQNENQIAKDSTSNKKDSLVIKEKMSFTIGILQGGGALVGADLEFLLSDRFGFQIGGGVIGYGAALNYHFSNSIRSSFISLCYWNQGIGDSFAQNAVGATYVYRGKKWFTFQLGLGLPLSKGPGMPEDFEQPPVMLLYSIGAYFPF